MGVVATCFELVTFQKFSLNLKKLHKVDDTGSGGMKKLLGSQCCLQRLSGQGCRSEWLPQASLGCVQCLLTRCPLKRYSQKSGQGEVLHRSSREGL